VEVTQLDDGQAIEATRQATEWDFLANQAWAMGSTRVASPATRECRLQPPGTQPSETSS